MRSIWTASISSLLVVGLSCSNTNDRRVATVEVAQDTEPAVVASEPPPAPVASESTDAAPHQPDRAEPPLDLEALREIPPPLEHHTLATPDLRRVKIALTRRLAAVQKAAPGIHPVPELDGRRLGRSYTQVIARLGEGEIEQVLTSLVVAHARPSPYDPVFYTRADGAPLRAAAEIRTAFDVHSQLRPAEARALDALVAQIEARLAAHPTIQAYRLHAGWGDAVGAAYHGVAFIGPDHDEVVWIFTEEIWFEG